MRIAQIAPLAESVPPRRYGGTERVVAYLTDALTAMGHDVTLFAAGDSKTSARLVPCCPRALRTDVSCRDPLAYHVAMIERVWAMRERFDIIHNHVDYLPLPLLSRQPTPLLTTPHGRLDWPEFAVVYRDFRALPAVSISEAQRRPLPWMNWIGTVHHGLPPDSLRPTAKPGRYLAFLGRLSPEKDPVSAINVAIRAGLPLRIAAKVDRVDQVYFQTAVAPLLDHPLIEYIGEIGECDKEAFLGEALALLFLIDWPEPFGMVMIEAMACGTPVIAMRRGSVPEVIDDGITGFIVDDEAGALAAIARAPLLDRARIRRVFERRFTAQRMAADYLRLYARLLDSQPAPLAAAGE
jgi:glycosyltransferase involved in cell wall biosynthesis